MIGQDLLKTLVCPETRAPLAVADDELIARLNRQIAAGRLHNRGGQAVRQPFVEGLVRQDRMVFYPIVDGIPVMLIDESIALDQLD